MIECEAIYQWPADELPFNGAGTMEATLTINQVALALYISLFPHSAVSI
jgi:hypothetical protein